MLDDYIRTSERFRVIQVFFGVPETYENSPGSIWALLGFRGKRERRLRPPRLSPNWTRGRGSAPSFLLFSFPFPSLILLLLGRAPSSTGKGGILLPMGVGLP